MFLKAFESVLVYLYTGGTATELGVTTQMVLTTDVARGRFTPEERQCFFEDEIRMVNCNIDVGCRYEFSNCLLEAFTDKVDTFREG